MLTKFSSLKDWFPKKNDSEWEFEEITFDKEAESSLASLRLNQRTIKVFNSSAKIMNSEGNHCYIPSQSFLYAIKLRPLLILLNKYSKLYEEFFSAKVTAEKAGQIVDLIQSRGNGLAHIDALDPLSRDNFFDLLDPRGAEDVGKKFINGRTLRRDGFESAILKIIPVPDSNSSELAKLLLGISSDVNIEILNLLQRKYSYAVPWLFQSSSPDELMYRVMSTLGWEGRLDWLDDAGNLNWCGINNAFLLRPKPIAGNEDFYSSPIHYLTASGNYVFFRKGLLNAITLDIISSEIANLWPSMCIRFRGDIYYVESERRHRISNLAVRGGSNRIFYGAPGTGKSHRVHNECANSFSKFVTVFHADTQHADFVGALKPVTENGQVFYRFRPGPFTSALIHALLYPDQKVTLIIEEINRASAAAVFGELFQLLDRNPDGESTYTISAADPDMLGYINQALGNEGLTPLDVLRIPANLSLLATMNSSDQAVMPLDTAFKRRWQFEYLPIDFSADFIPQTEITLQTRSGPVTVSWPSLAKIINAALELCDVPEDRLLGPFFLSAKELEDEDKVRSALAGKLFIYLWDDVLRHHGHDHIFASGYKTYGALSAAFRAGRSVFSSNIEEQLFKADTKVEAAFENTATTGRLAQDAIG